MSAEAALAIALLVTCAIGYGICAFAKWHQTRYLRVPNSVINAHKITPRFSVGSAGK